MYPYYSYLKIPTYGLFVLIGLFFVNVIALVLIKKGKDKDVLDFLLIECYVILGAALGSKMLYLVTIINKIDVTKLSNLRYVLYLMNTGFVFYGGLIGAIISLFLVHYIHKISVLIYINDMCFLFPLVHAFGRVGCFCSGCCFGKPYDGLFSVVYPENAITDVPTGIPLFPVQIVEAALLLFIAILLFFLVSKQIIHNGFVWYLLIYSILRFVLEYFRYDSERGMIGSFSLSQWISIFLFSISILYLAVKKKDNPTLHN